MILSIVGVLRWGSACRQDYQIVKLHYLCMPETGDAHLSGVCIAPVFPSMEINR